MILFGLALALAGIIVLIAGAAQVVSNRYYSTGMEPVTGTITHKQSRQLKNGRAYELTVSYIVNGNSYKRVVGSMLTEFEAIKEGDKLELLYKSDNPKKAIRPEVLESKYVRVPLIIGAALLAAGVAMLFIIRLINT